MRQFVILLIFIFGSSVAVNAQNYLEHLKQKNDGQGTVTISQSKQIDELVNGKPAKAPDTPVKSVTPAKGTAAPHHQQGAVTTEKPSAPKEEAAKVSTEKEETERPAVDMRKKVMRGSYKVTGYRVQAYAGGNSRNDRLQAEKIGNAIKLEFPDQPVYVHFYSPRWICRVGNFKTQAEAVAMLKKIKAMGYKQACLVKGQITVQN